MTSLEVICATAITIIFGYSIFFIWWSYLNHYEYKKSGGRRNYLLNYSDAEKDYLKKIHYEIPEQPLKGKRLYWRPTFWGLGPNGLIIYEDGLKTFFYYQDRGCYRSHRKEDIKKIIFYNYGLPRKKEYQWGESCYLKIYIKNGEICYLGHYHNFIRLEEIFKNNGFPVMEKDGRSIADIHKFFRNEFEE